MGLIKGFALTTSILFAILGVWVYFSFIKTEPSPLFELNDGKVQGIRLKSREGREFYAFYGLPYAKPPVGQLRFEPPEPNEPWEGIRDASSIRGFCAQLEPMTLHIKTGSEDCLYLNVFVPANVPKTKKLPVLFYIHGGYFHVGSGVVSGPRYFMDHDVILVTINYRLAALGFLNTGDSVVRGNMGLKDQQLALKWTQRNIEAFNGDKAKVTILGESAGGASVGYQMLSPGSKGLFWRAISESGSPLNYWTMYRNVKKQSQHYAKTVNCPTESSRSMVECLKALDTDAILNGHREMEAFPYYPFIGKFVPTIETVKDDKAFLTEEPLKLLQTGRYSQVPHITGFSADEGLLHSASLWVNETKLNEVQDWNAWAPKALHYDKSRTDVSKKLKDFYLGKDAKDLNSLTYFQNITNMYGDRLFNMGVSQTALLERAFNPVYTYMMEHEAGITFSIIFGAAEDKYNPLFYVIRERLQYLYVTYILGEKYQFEIKGTCHGDENPLLYSNPVFESLYHKVEDVKMSKALVKLWVDFASGKDKLTFQGTQWTPNKGKEKEGLTFLKMNLTHPKMISEPFKERRLFWEQNIDLVPE